MNYFASVLNITLFMGHMIDNPYIYTHTGAFKWIYNNSLYNINNKRFFLVCFFLKEIGTTFFFNVKIIAYKYTGDKIFVAEPDPSLETFYIYIILPY